ncbi:hypothetical protein ACHHYP_16730 [Achlya hypogyna]|uniref:Rab-GAP TBC domain-containing protein n=1 Tax=Achlya hypogyna TaxID=1202772 RepID=A0A1V9Y5X2_ACHHY|nr:hypothetical protein ACHHYP_16730 [Achlya hypogyna]
MEVYPSELREVPCPLVAALGPKDIQTRVLPVLRSVNDEFIPRIHFTSTSFEHRFVFPAKKEKTESKPRGLLKAQWLKKHHELLPSLVLLFYAFEPRLAARDWAIQETVIRDEVEDLRRNLSGRECKILLVLVQFLDDGPPSNGGNADERLSSLRKRAELDSKSVWLLKDIGRTAPSVIKLEKAIREHAIEYYKTQAKRVKKSKKPTRAVAVRHSFKVAHFYEFRRHTVKMLTHYEAAYKALLSLPMADAAEADAHAQIKAVAEFVHFKLVYHHIFSTHNLKLAIDQMQRHMKAFSRAVGPLDRAHEHWAWVSRQYHVFGQLLLEAQSLRLSSTGIESDMFKEAYLYFSAAAKYATWRRKAAAKMQLGYDPATADATAATLAAATVTPSVYVGGDPSVAGLSLAEYRQLREKSVYQAQLGIRLLELASQYLVHYQSNHMPRHRLKNRFLLRLGIERLAAQDYDQARIDLQRAKVAYSQERWWALVSQVLKQLLLCALQQQDTLAFLDFSLQLLSPKVEEFVPAPERQQLHEGFLRAWATPAATGLLPLPEPAYELALDRARPMVFCGVEFAAPEAYVCEQIVLRITLESALPAPLAVARLAVVFSDDRYDQVLEHGETTDLTLPPRAAKELSLTLTLLPDGAPGLQCHEVRFVLENAAGQQLVLVARTSRPNVHVLKRRNSLVAWDGVVPGMGQGAGSPSFQRRPPELLYEEPDDAREDIGSFVTILQPKAHARLALAAGAPAAVLVGDLTTLPIELSSLDDVVDHATYRVVCEPSVAALLDAPLLCDADSGDPLVLDDLGQPVDAFPLVAMAPHATQCWRIALRCAAPCSLKLHVTVQYTTALGVVVALDATFDVECKPPFELAAMLHASFPSAQPATMVGAVGRPALLYATLASAAAGPLEVLSVALEVATDAVVLQSVAGTLAADSALLELGHGDRHSVVATMVPQRELAATEVGSMRVVWRRPGAGVVTSRVSLPPMTFVRPPVTVDVDVPAFGREGALSPLVLRTTNHTATVLKVLVQLSNDSDFLVSGVTECTEEVLPGEVLVSVFGLIPMQPGHLKLPKMEVVLADSKETIVSSAERTELYVVPASYQAAEAKNASLTEAPVVLWRGWLRKLGRFSKRWQRRYFVFVKCADAKELRFYDSTSATHPEGIMSLTDATGVCYLDTVMTTHAAPQEASSDHKFAILTPDNVWLLGFNNHDPESSQEDGLALLGALSAFYPLVDVLHWGFLTKRRERTVQSAKNIIAYWKRHFFVYLASGDLLYFNDDSLSTLQGRVDVKHAPTVRVTGEQQSLLRAKKEAGFFNLAKMRAFEHDSCLIWIATPPSKMFVLKLYDDKERAVGVPSSARKWLALLLQGHAETKYVQLEHCCTANAYDQTPEVVSALRAGIPDELRGALWKGFSGAYALHAAARQPSADATVDAAVEALILARLQALVVHSARQPRPHGRRRFDSDTDDEAIKPSHAQASTYPGELWRATSTFTLPYCHPCPWRMTCLLLAYLDEASAFWVVNSLVDHVLPGYFHGHRPALLVDAAVFRVLLHDQAPSLAFHLEAIGFPIDALVQRWFVSLFTASRLPLSTVLRIWDLVFAQGLRILHGLGVALLLKSEQQLFCAASSREAWAALHASERGTVDADGLFATVFKDDLHMPWLLDDSLERLRIAQRTALLSTIGTRIAACHEKLGVLNAADETFRSLRQAVEIYDEHGNQEVMTTLRRQLGDVGDATQLVVAAYKAQQAQWLTVSSQVAAVPLGLRGQASDVQSWLAQVREGKISGAGTDAAPEVAHDMLFPPEAPASGPALMEAPPDSEAERFLYGVAMVAKSACAARLHFLAARQVTWWHSGAWLATASVEKKAFVTEASCKLEPKDFSVAEAQFLDKAQRLWACLHQFAASEPAESKLKVTADAMAADLKDTFARVEHAIRGPSWLQ